VKHNLENCTLQDKKKALNALDVQIVAIPQEMKIRIAVPLEFITIGQTWGCMFTYNKNHRAKVTGNLPFNRLIFGEQVIG
jgi:hypothetical protein